MLSAIARRANARAGAHNAAGQAAMPVIRDAGILAIAGGPPAAVPKSAGGG